MTRREGSPADEFVLTRFIVSCCVADALSVQVRVVGAPPGRFERTSGSGSRGPSTQSAGRSWSPPARSGPSPSPTTPTSTSDRGPGYQGGRSGHPRGRCRGPGHRCPRK
ncbi:MAG: hypothetical protein ACRDHH_05020 [Actinomycetota bacterium]